MEAVTGFRLVDVNVLAVRIGNDGAARSPPHGRSSFFSVRKTYSYTAAVVVC
jgi:hypothetical protein